MKKQKSKIIYRDFRYTIDYHSPYGELSPFFEGLKERKLMGTFCRHCQITYATARLHCSTCGKKCWWTELPQEGTVHTYTTCHYGSQEFLKQTPYHLILVQFEGIDTLFFSQLKRLKKSKINIGMKVKAQFQKRLKMKVSDVYFVPA